MPVTVLTTPHKSVSLRVVFFRGPRTYECLCLCVKQDHKKDVLCILLIRFYFMQGHRLSEGSRSLSLSLGLPGGVVKLALHLCPSQID